MAPISLTLLGITNDGHDETVDLFRTVTLPLLSRFGLEEGLEFKIVARGAPPEGGGMVTLVCPSVRKLRALRMFGTEKIKRIRGIAYSTRVAPTMANRMVEGAKEVLASLTQDVFIYVDHYKGGEGRSFLLLCFNNVLKPFKSNLGAAPDTVARWWQRPLTGVSLVASTLRKEEGICQRMLERALRVNFCWS